MDIKSPQTLNNYLVNIDLVNYYLVYHLFDNITIFLVFPLTPDTVFVRQFMLKCFRIESE